MTTKTKARRDYRKLTIADSESRSHVGKSTGAGGNESEMSVPAVLSCCGRFAEALDWQFSASVSPESDGPVEMLLEESEHGLHSERYIKVNVLPTMDTIWLAGGYYDVYYYPITVFNNSVRLNGLDGDTLGGALEDVYDRLDGLSISYRNRRSR